MIRKDNRSPKRMVIAKEIPDSATILRGVIILADLVLFNSEQLFPKKITIQRLVDVDLEIAAQVIRESFATVADDFDLTIDNCPTNGAFTQAKHLKIDLEKGNQLFGLYLGKKMIGFFELVAIIPPERGKKYGEFILDKVREIAKNDHIERIDIGIIKENIRLKEWYQRNGYQIVRSQNFAHLPFEVLYMQLNLNNEVSSG